MQIFLLKNELNGFIYVVHNTIKESQIWKLEGPVHVLFHSTPSFIHANNYEILKGAIMSPLSYLSCLAKKHPGIYSDKEMKAQRNKRLCSSESDVTMFSVICEPVFLKLNTETVFWNFVTCIYDHRSITIFMVKKHL